MDALTDPLEWITEYLTLHSLSVPSRRYSFILWLAVVFIFLVFAILHWTGCRGGVCGAIWSKWSLRRRTWRKHARTHRQAISLPSNAQLLSLFVLTVASLALAFVGPDDLATDIKVWQINTRSYDASTVIPVTVPQNTLVKSLWSSSARTGQIAFALLPLCVLFALKAPPFAIFAIPFMIQLYFDKLAWLHRWAGRLIWFLTLIHVVLWSIQLAKDVNPSTGRVAYVYAWSYTPFIFGWIAFTLLTLIILLSLHPIRRRFYESFYILHLLLVPSMLIMAGLHHPTVAWWCWAALAVWIGERLWRGTWWIYANGILDGITIAHHKHPPPQDTFQLAHVRHPSTESASSHLLMDGRSFSPLHDYYDKSPISTDIASEPQSPPSLPHSAERYPSSSTYVPPPGYVHAELLSGRTMRLRIITPGFLPWSPGQHFLLNIPSVSRFTSHPFTCASVCDEEAPTDAGRIMLFLVRAKSGWTQNLWNFVSRLIAERSKGDASPDLADGLPKHSVLLRAYVDGPFGSAKRARWGNHSTGIIITGGSGVSFGLSVLQYMCMCLSGRDGRNLGGRPGGWGWKGAELQRVRFIWLVREFSHVQWCASILRRCTSIVPSSALQIDIFVTNFKPVPLKYPTPSRRSESAKLEVELQPPLPSFARESSSHFRSGSPESLETHESDVDLSYYLGENLDDEPFPDEMRMAHDANMLELTNFDGDVDIALPGEAHLSRRLKKEGKLRRLQSRRRMNQDTRSGARTRQLDRDSVLSPPRKVRPSFARSTDRSALSESLNSASPSAEVYSPSLDFSSTVSLVTAGSPRMAGHPTRGLQEVKSETEKPHAVQMPHPLALRLHDSRSSVYSRLTSDAIPFEMDEGEAMDVNVVSEHARPGKPRLDKVIADEVQASKGAIIVACCGPTSLNGLVRKIVASHIDPGRVRRGDMRGSIALVSEEFEY